VLAEERTNAARSGAGPLAGLKVLDFTHVFAGPFCTRTLADLGADVVHVESRSRDHGDTLRAAYAHRNKRSICLDLKNADGHALATRLGVLADALVENFSSGVMRRLKLDDATLRPSNPGLIFLSLSGYGHTGPRSTWTSMNMNLQAYTGLMMTTGAPDDPPTAISNSWNDYIGGLHGVIAVLQALDERVTSGSGRHIDLSQFECSVATLGALLMASAVSGRPPARMGSRSSSAAPQGVYPCAGDDDWCAVAVETDAQWRGLAGAIGRPDLAADERFATCSGRMRHHDALDGAIAAWTRERSAGDAEQRLRQAGVPTERMRRVADLVEGGAGGYRHVPGERPRPLLAASLPFTFSASTVEPVGAPCSLGEHTAEVLHDWLGLEATEIGALDGRHAFG
jgi:benzylsuccinate CoA-transferase BbsF subunit